VGASGAISTVIAMVMLYDPWKLSFLLVGFPMPLGVAGLTFVLLNFWMANKPIDNTASMHVAYSVHIIGFALGILFSILLNPDWKKNLLACILLFIGYYAVAYWLINLLTRH
jgi:membrane associated rhomboid family serine protease